MTKPDPITVTADSHNSACDSVVVPDLQAVFGAALRREAAARGVGVREIARRVYGEAERASTVNRYMRGTRNATLDTIERFARALRVEPARLLTPTT